MATKTAAKKNANGNTSQETTIQVPAKVTMQAKKKDLVIELPALDLKQVEIILIGDTPLICNQWSEKAKQAMRDAQGKKPQQKKEAKDSEAIFRASLYEVDGGYGFPAVGIKKAAIDACSYVGAVTKVAARGTFHIHGEYVVVQGKPHKREDMVRVGMDKADLRYRGCFNEWRITFTVTYNAAVLSVEQIANLFNLAGFSVGIGDYRPQRNGPFGRFHVATAAEMKG